MMRPAVQGRAAAVAPDRVPATVTPAEESLRVAILLSLAGGFLDAFTWIEHHGVMANAQTANVVLLAVYGAAGQWTEALRLVAPITAFLFGVFIVCRLRAHCDDRSRYQFAMMTIVIEVAVLVVAMTLHVRLPDIAGTVGISFAAAMQTASFAKLEGGSYSSVMVTGNLRSSVETFVAGWIEMRDAGARRRAVLLAAVCVTFALGAAVGAILTKTFAAGALLVPIALLVTALALCGRVPARRST
jgi:uncharacterized membrane protein YoaK (UPF0700 family)